MINLEKEIREQPEALAKVLGDNMPTVDAIVKEAKEAGVTGIYFAARGTSDHACVYAQYLFGILAGLPCTLGTPSVFTKYGARVHLKGMLVIGVSQSGKAEDVLEVLKSANEEGAITVAVTNNLESPMAKTAKYHLFCDCGFEASIAATKTFTTQMMLLAAIAGKWAGNVQFLENLANVMNVSKASLMIDFNQNSQNIIIERSNEIANVPFEEQTGITQAILGHARAELRLLNYGKLSKEYASKIEENPSLEKPFIEYLEEINQKIWLELVDNYYIYHKEFNEGEFVHVLDQNLLNAYITNITSLQENGDDMNKYSEDDMNECLKALIYYSPKKEIDKIDQGFTNLKENEKLANLLLKVEKLKKLYKINKKTNGSRN